MTGRAKLRDMKDMVLSVDTLKLWKINVERNETIMFLFIILFLIWKFYSIRLELYFIVSTT
jgi:hypothetical protein